MLEEHPQQPTTPPECISDSRSPRRKRKDSDSDDSEKALADLELWSHYEEKLEEVLPSELLGWLFLRRAGLSAQARLSVQAASGNSLRLDRVGMALRGMEDELLAQEQTEFLQLQDDVALTGLKRKVTGAFFWPVPMTFKRA